MKRLKSWVWHYLLSRLPEVDYLSNSSNGRLYHSNKDHVIGRHLFVYGGFEWDKILTGLETLKHFTKGKNDLLIDIGANIGTVCIPLVKNGHFQRALAFEPDPNNFRRLQKNIKVNKLEDKITAFQMALSDHSGQMDLLLSEDNFGDHSLSVKNKNVLNRNKVSVEVDTLDNVLLKNKIESSKISAIWMDVQGHEPYVIKGAEKSLSSGAPLISEFWPAGLARAQVTPGEFKEILTKNFTSFYNIDDKKLTQNPIADVEKLYTQYTKETFTDLILIK